MLCREEVEPGDLKVQLGSNKFPYDVELILPKEGYNKRTFENDIGLLKLKMDAEPAGKDAGTAEIMNIPKEDELKEGTELEFIGWGRLNVSVLFESSDNVSDGEGLP